MWNVSIKLWFVLWKGRDQTKLHKKVRNLPHFNKKSSSDRLGRRAIVEGLREDSLISWWYIVSHDSKMENHSSSKNIKHAYIQASKSHTKLNHIDKKCCCALQYIVQHILWFFIFISFFFAILFTIFFDFLGFQVLFFKKMVIWIGERSNFNFQWLVDFFTISHVSYNASCPESPKRHLLTNFLKIC